MGDKESRERARGTERGKKEEGVMKEGRKIKDFVASFVLNGLMLIIE